jgi:hypothetical protein
MSREHLRLIEALAKLDRRWRNQGVELESALDRVRVEERFATAGRRVSSDILALYSSIGGMIDGQMDDNNFSLWTLDHAVERNREFGSEHWFFADCLIDSQLYATRIDSIEESSVLKFLTVDYGPTEIASTVEEFFVRLADATSDEERWRVLL